MTAGSLLFKKR